MQKGIYSLAELSPPPCVTVSKVVIAAFPGT